MTTAFSNSLSSSAVATTDCGIAEDLTPFVEAPVEVRIMALSRGPIPAESIRLTRAFHYHNFAMPPLVALAEITIADGRDPYARRVGQLHKMARFVSDAIDNPALMTAVQDAILGPGQGAIQGTSMRTGPECIVAHKLPNSSQMAWMWIYCRRFPNTEVARKWAPRLVEVYSSLRSSNLGGDMRLLYPWRHPMPGPIIVTGGPELTSLHVGPTVTGTAEPGAALTLIIDGDDERFVMIAANGAWSFDLGDLGPGTYARDCQDFRVWAAIVDPTEVPDGTTQSPPYSGRPA